MFLLWLIEKKCEEIESKFIEYKKTKIRKKIKEQKNKEENIMNFLEIIPFH